MLYGCICGVGSVGVLIVVVVVLLFLTTYINTTTNTTNTSIKPSFTITYTTQHTLNYVTSGDDGGSDYEWVVMVAVVIRAPTNLKLATTSPKLTAKCFLNIASKKPH